LTTPRHTRAALALVTRWSEPNAEAYLVEIRSFPLPRWRKLRARVIKRAFELGLAVPRTLVERAQKELGALPQWPEIVAQSMKRFAEISAHDQPNDLSASEEAGNWELLLREAAQAGIPIDQEYKALCAAAQRRARVGHTGGVDLRSLGTAELVALLEQKDLRREAALILCERREAGTLPAVFAAMRRMPRQEANFLLPMLTRFGPEVERWLAEGLRSKKSFLRQGSALALGALKTPGAVEALARLLVTEPTEIWTEVARALGDAGLAAVAPLSALLPDADGDKVERVVEALAHVAARGGVMAHTSIEALAQRDGLVAEVAERALAKVGEVRAADVEVRRGQQESTVVRDFSRRFYDVLRGDASNSHPVELSPADLEEVEDEDFESSDEKMITHTDIPALIVPEDATTPNPKSTLPRGRS
jgi:HEAT repeat protein